MNRKKKINELKKIYSNGLKERENYLKDYSKFLKKFFKDIDLKKFIFWMSEKKEKIKILDIGCGNAGFLKNVKEILGKKVFTIGLDLVDFDQKVDEKILGDAVYIPWPDNCDLIVSFRTLHEIGETEQIVKKVIESLSNEGIAVLSIRIQEIQQNNLEYLGLMTKKDTDFLIQIGKKGFFEKAKIESVESYKEKNEKKFLTGITILIEKS